MDLKIEVKSDIENEGYEYGLSINGHQLDVIRGLACLLREKPQLKILLEKAIKYNEMYGD